MRLIKSSSFKNAGNNIFQKKSDSALVREMPTRAETKK
jgi:hypothetical protein